MYFYLKKLDLPLLGAVLLLSGVGLLTIYQMGGEDALFYFKRQLLFVGIGLIAMFLLIFFDYRILKNNSLALIVAYLASLISLVLVLFSQEIRGAASWYRLGAFNFGPVEFAKIVIILFLAKYFSQRHIEMYRIRHLMVSGFYLGLFALAVFLQPDLGSTLVLVFIWLGIVMISGIKLRHLLALGLLGVVLFAAGWAGLLKDYQKDRIIGFIDPQSDPYGSGYHITQSLIAVGSGGFWGQTKGESSQAGLKFLPEKHTDFIFAAFAERWGISGVLVLLFLYALMFWRIIKIAVNSANNFCRLYLIGFCLMLFVQIMVNIGMNIALLPITGLTLPLISYGGSSVISILIGFGLVQSIKVRSQEIF